LVLTASLDRFVHIYSIDINPDEDVANREKGLDVKHEGTLF